MMDEVSTFDENDDELLVPSRSTFDNDELPPGGVNTDRTYCKCFYCEVVMTLDPTWTHDQTCPHCEESIFTYVCPNAACQYSGYNIKVTEPPFPDTSTCAVCEKTLPEIQQEEQEEQSYEQEWERVSRGAEYRHAKALGLHQRRIGATFRNPASLVTPPPGVMSTQTYEKLSLSERVKVTYTDNPPSLVPPVAEFDALRLSPEVWESLRPIVIRELQEQSPLLTVTLPWCQAQLQFFERTWLEANEKALKVGIKENKTGGKYFSIVQKDAKFQYIKVPLRLLREGHGEEGVWPTASGVTITGPSSMTGGPRYKDYKPNKMTKHTTSLSSNLQVTWWIDEASPHDQERIRNDAKEMYRIDSNRTVTWGEFLVWTARVGGIGGQPFNPKWVSTEDTVQEHAADVSCQPTAYVPSDWCGLPNKWLEEEQSDFHRWYWMHDLNLDVRGRPLTMTQLTQLSQENMQVCSVCYQRPSSSPSSSSSQDEEDELSGAGAGYSSTEASKTSRSGSTIHSCGLILCDCRDVFYCSKTCQDKDWPVHSLDPQYSHPLAERLCLNCGDSRPISHGMKKCGQCANAFFCNATCQKKCWKEHKKVCLPVSK